MTFEEIYTWIESLKKIEKLSIAEKTVKLCEEAGEFSAEILRYLGQKEHNGSQEELMDHLLEEGCDIIVTALALFARLGFSEEEIIQKMEDKINVWIKKVTNESLLK